MIKKEGGGGGGGEKKKKKEKKVIAGLSSLGLKLGYHAIIFFFGNDIKFLETGFK